MKTKTVTEYAPVTCVSSTFISYAILAVQCFPKCAPGSQRIRYQFPGDPRMHFSIGYFKVSLFFNLKWPCSAKNRGGASWLQNVYVVHSPTNAPFISLVKSFKFTLKYTIISLLHVSVFSDHHQGALSVPNWTYIYVKTLGKITSLYMLGDVAASRRAQNTCVALQLAATSSNKYNDVILPSVLT